MEPLDLGPDVLEVTAASFRLDDLDHVWHVAEGTVDLFTAVEDDAGEQGRRRPLVTCEAGSLMAGLPKGEIVVVGRGAPGSRILRISREALAAVAERQCDDVAAGFDAWLEPVLERLRGDELPPREFTPLDAGESVDVDEGDVVRPVGGLRWFEAPGVRLRGRAGSRVLEPGELAPAGEGNWLVAEGPATVRACSTAELVASGRLWEMFDPVARQAVRALRIAAARMEEEEMARVSERSARDRELRAEVEHELALLMEPARNGRVVRAGRDPAIAVASIIGRDLGVEAKRPPPSARLAPRVDELGEIVRASGMYMREVAMRPGWWKEDAGPLIGFRADDERPVALLRRTRGYVLHDPVTGEERRVDARVAGELGPRGRSIYRQLPDRPLSGWHLIRFGAKGTRRDFATFLAAALAVAGLSLLVPLAAGEILGRLVLEGARDTILDVCVGLLAAAFVALLLAAVQNLAALRLEGRLQAQIQEGIWGRIMRLSPAFFRRYSTGDLATRALGLTQVQELLGSLGIKMAVASVTALANVTLILVYDWRLGLLTVGLFLLLLAVCVPVMRRSLVLQRESFDHQRQVNSRAFQLFGHVGKLRAAAAEERAFAFWAEAFGRSRDATYAARRIQNRFAATAAAFALASYAAVFLFAGSVFDVSQQTFFVFSLAYAQAMAGVLLVLVTAVNSMPVVPLLEGMRPIMRAVPEVSDQRADPGELAGGLQISAVSFAYSEESPTVLEGVSFSVEPGEFVAIVGPSGSGKSTLLRLMLGFEAPTAGAVLYDGQDLGDLDVAAVRRQCGVVLQDAQLFAGDILSNVVGSGVYTADDAWEAIEMVGMDEDISRMPMGMFTVLSEGAGTLSGGQRQRVALARALVARPRIIFLDEATSALDNVAQAQVMESMRRMNATRVVVAHRLSTIRDADRIVVLKDGRVVETGAYEDLMSADGVFARLAERQLA